MHFLLQSSTLLGSALLALLLSAPLASGTGDYGPDTCLQGWVWREAYTNDHVCVTPQTRTQAADDNAAAASRKQPGGGPYGPDTCKQGFVWREANPSDHVCVTPDIRSATAADNAQAANQRDSMNVWLNDWYPPQQCNGDTCTTTSDADIPRFKVNGDHFNLASITVGIYKSSDNSVIWKQDMAATFHNGYVAGSFGIQAPVVDCAGDPKTPLDGYVKVYDSVSYRWSNPIYVHTGCATL